MDAPSYGGKKGVAMESSYSYGGKKGVAIGGAPMMTAVGVNAASLKAMGG